MSAAVAGGWSQEDVEILRDALLFFGVGNWSAIIASGCLPGKTIGQLNSQTQRLLGQQSTAEYADLHIDVFRVGADNARRTDVTRKAGLIVNTGRPLTRDEIRAKIEDNRLLYEVGEATRSKIVLPQRAFLAAEEVLAQKRAELHRLRHEQSLIAQVLAERNVQAQAGRVAVGADLWDAAAVQ